MGQNKLHILKYFSFKWNYPVFYLQIFSVQVFLISDFNFFSVTPNHQIVSRIIFLRQVATP